MRIKPQPCAMPRRQQGMTLIVGLIMLVLITLATVASFNIGRTSMDIIGNMQHRNEAIAAANSAIQEALSTTRLFDSPGAILANPCAGVPNRRCIDSNGDGTADVTVDLRGTATANPTCVQARTILNAELEPELESPDPIIAENANKCQVSDPPGLGGVKGVPTGNSLCADSVWEVVADAADAVTQATVTVTQGAAVRVATSVVATFCP